MYYRFPLFFLLICFSFLSSLSGESESCTTKDSGYPKEGAPRRAIVKTALKFGKDHGLVLRSEGTGCSVTGARNQEDSLWGILMTCNQKMTLEEGLLLAQSLGEALMDTVDNDPAMITYYQKADHRLSDRDHALSFRLAFWDENVERPLYPYIADIRLVNTEFRCAYADPKTQALQTPPIVKPFMCSKKN